MAATEILAVADTAATSSDVTITAGEEVAFCLKGVTGPNARVLVEAKDDAGAYTWTGEELTASQPAKNINVVATIRFRRVAGATCGVFRAG